MARGAAAAAKADDDGGGGGQGESRGSKRRCVQSACVPCRKRKSKCDGGTPVCATCTAVYKTDCHYDEASEGRRANKTTTPVKREPAPQQHPDASDNAEFLVRSIRHLPESELCELLQHIRKDPRLDINELAETWRKTVALPVNSGEQTSLEGDLSLLLGKPALTQTGESRHFGHTSSMGLVPEDENYTRSGVHSQQPPQEHKNGTWTAVTQDIRFVERLLDLYFTWSHPFYVVFSRECFLRDFRSGRPKYCSPLLVNAILSYGCHFTDEPAGRTDPNNFRTAGDPFFAEARRLLYEDDTPALTTVQALCVMALREPSAGRDSSGFMYIGRCMRMAVELGLHLNNTAPAQNLTPSEIEVRKVTFWGCFVVDTLWSVCVGRISQLPRAAITVDKPILEEPNELPGAHQLAPGTVTTRMFLQEFSTLSELINDNNFMFFAPKERFTSRRLLDMYHRYQNWYRDLPPPLRLPDRPDIRPMPHIVALHMLYYTVLVHLFRPMLKVDLIHSEVRPRDICIESADKVTDLLRLYRQHYDFRAGQLVVTHILLSVSVVHLLYSQDYPQSEANLIDSLQALEDLSVCHYFGARSFKIVHALAKTWNLPWPEALKLSKLVPKENAPLTSPATETLFRTQPTAIAQQEVAANALPNRRESLSMFSPEHTNMPLSSTNSSPPNNVVGAQLQSPSNGQYTAPASNPTTSSAPEHAETLFWTPPGVGIPILARNYQSSAMDLNNMLGNVGEWDRFGRDGFKMSDTWQQEQMGYNVHASAAVAGAPQGFENQSTGLAPTGPGYEWWAGNPGPGPSVG